MSITRRKDNKGRVLNENEFQKSDGRYEYRYRDLNGKSRSVYSWKLTASDRLPKGRPGVSTPSGVRAGVGKSRF